MGSALPTPWPRALRQATLGKPAADYLAHAGAACWPVVGRRPHVASRRARVNMWPACLGSFGSFGSLF